jgi:hypothetical protein
MSDGNEAPAGDTTATGGGMMYATGGAFFAHPTSPMTIKLTNVTRDAQRCMASLLRLIGRPRFTSPLNWALRAGDAARSPPVSPSAQRSRQIPGLLAPGAVPLCPGVGLV